MLLAEHWPLIEADLQDAGIDVGDDALMDTRSWRWLTARIAGLLSAPVGHDFAGNPLFRFRLQQALTPRGEAARTNA